MHFTYESRTSSAIGCATLFGARHDLGCYAATVDTADHILDELKRRQVKHAAIADVLGVSVTNATKLFNPATKTGKPRRLTYDEGKRLIDAFELNGPAPDPMPPIALPVARLAVRYVLERVGARPEPAVLEELSRDIQAFSGFASQPQMRDSESHAEGFFAGLDRRGRQVA